MRSHAASPGSLYSARGQRKYLNPEERRRFLAAADACDRAELRTLCLVLAYTGCRISEALSLTADAVDREGGLIAVRSLKKRSREAVIREIPVPPFLFQVLEDVHGVSRLPLDARLWRLSRCRAWQLVKLVMAQAGIRPGPQATPKGLRHGFGIHAVQCGVPLNLVQRWLGHADMETTAIYLNATGAEERVLASRMWTLPTTDQAA